MVVKVAPLPLEAATLTLKEKMMLFNAPLAICPSYLELNPGAQLTTEC